MRNLKKLFAVVVVIAVMLTTMIPAAFAEGTTSISADAQACATLGMLQGDGNGVTYAYTQTQPARIQAAIMLLRLKGLEAAAQATPVTADNFSDVTAAWQKPFTAYLKAHPELGFAGIGNNKFDPNSLIDAKQYYSVMLTVLGYSGDYTWATVMSKAAQVGLTKNLDITKLTVNDMAVATVEALNAKVKGSDKTLVASLADASADFKAKAIAAGFKLTAPTFAVKSVNAINAKQIKVVFTQPVDQTQAENEANYYLNNTALAAGTATATLQSDGVTVIITLVTALTNGATNVYQVEPMPSKTDALIVNTRFSSTEAFTDNVAPTVTSVDAKTNVSIANSITINYSEPVASGIIRIDGAGYAVVAGSTQTITGLALDVTKTHTLEYVNLTDAATVTANITAYGSLSFTITKDTTAPVITSIVPQGDKQAVVTFSKAMNPATLTGAITTANESLAPYTATIAPKSGDTTNTQFLVTVTQAGIYTSATTHTISIGFPATITDSLGNTLAAVTKTVTLTKDTTAPAVTDIVAEKNLAGQTTAIVVKYSKPLTAVPAGVLSSALTIVDSNGVLVTAPGLTANSAAIAANDTQVRFTFTAPAVMNVKWTVTVPASLVTDTSEGLNASTGFSKLVDMSQAAGAATFTLPQANATIAGQVITVVYPSAVKGGSVANSATDPNNYSINGVVLPAGTTITLDSATRATATITLPAGSLAASDANAVLRIANVQDLNGNTIVPFIKTIAVTDNTAPVFTSAVAASDNSLALGFSEAVTGLVPADIIVKVNGTAITIAGADITAGFGLNAGKWVVALGDYILYDAVNGTFVDVDGSGAYTAGDIVLVAGADVHAQTIANIPQITSVTVTTTGNTGADAAGIKVVANTTITVK